MKNGTLDLETGDLKPQDRHDYITKLVPVVYDPHAEAPRFQAFLKKIFAGNEALIQYIQRAVGYSLTGKITERVLFILHGGGKNGKSTLLETLRAMLGDDFAGKTPTRTIMNLREEGIPNDVARLQGMRMVYASETEEGQHLAESRIKDLTGGEKIPARFMRAEWFDFTPEFKLFLGTNHRPQIRGTDDAVWDRIHYIPFTVRIPDNEVDPDLKDKLLAELPGILAWAVEGCRQWHQKGLAPPQEVLMATKSYRGEEDVLAQFLEETCHQGHELKAPCMKVFEAYQSWCTSTGEPSLALRDFSKRLSERGFAKKKSTGGLFYWLGLGLRDSKDEILPLKSGWSGLKSGINSHERNRLVEPEKWSTPSTHPPIKRGNVPDSLFQEEVL